MIDVSLHTPIQDPSVYQFPLDLVSELLQRVGLYKCSFIGISVDLYANNSSEYRLRDFRIFLSFWTLSNWLSYTGILSYPGLNSNELEVTFFSLYCVLCHCTCIYCRRLIRVAG